MVLLWLAACGTPMEDWWTVDVGYTAPVVDTGDSGVVDDTEELADQRALHGYLAQDADGVDVALRYLWVDGGEIRCDVRYGSDKVRPVPCAACLTGLSILHSDSTIEDGADCGETDWDSYDGETLYVGLDSAGRAYRCTENCTEDTGKWVIAGEATPSKSGFVFVLPLAER